MGHNDAFCGQSAKFLKLNSTVCEKTTNHWNFKIVGSSPFWNMVIRIGVYHNVRDPFWHISDLIYKDASSQMWLYSSQVFTVKSNKRIRKQFKIYFTSCRKSS